MENILKGLLKLNYIPSVNSSYYIKRGKKVLTEHSVYSRNEMWADLLKIYPDGANFNFTECLNITLTFVYK